ncbi:recombinase family protein [Streptomyces sp. cg2]|uniref:recombinase family protein n=1 Tax=Streptomyces sp. cg2 TaxID=3238799 RepID=UPI0034E20797
MAGPLRLPHRRRRPAPEPGQGRRRQTPAPPRPRRRTPHRAGYAWSKSAVRAILSNPRYTGYEVWNKQRKDEVLLDIDDVTLGHRTKLTWNTPDQWIWSDRPVHEPLITMETFKQAQAKAGVRRTAAGERSPRTTTRSYPLRGRLRCGICHRKMQGNYNNGKPHYRCRYTAEYVKNAALDHLLPVYVREEVVLPLLDAWIARVFAPATSAAPSTPCAKARNSHHRRLLAWKPHGVPSPTHASASPATAPSSTPEPTRFSSPDGSPKPRPRNPPPDNSSRQQPMRGARSSPRNRSTT